MLGAGATRRQPRRAATPEELQNYHRSFLSAQSSQSNTAQHGSVHTAVNVTNVLGSATTWCRHTAEDPVFACHLFHSADHQNMPKRMRARFMKTNLDLVDLMEDGRHQYNLRTPGQTRRRVCCQGFAAYFGLQKRTVEKALKAANEAQEME